MDKIIEALSKVLSDEQQLKDVASAVESYLGEAKVELEQEFETKLNSAYEELSNEVKTAEKTAEQGYQEAFAIISDLRNRLETQRSEFESALEEGYEEAYQMLVSERGKNTNIEADLYEEYDKKLSQMKEFMIDKIDEFLAVKGKDIYEQARRELMNDPAIAEHKVTLNKIIEHVSDYITDEEYALATSSKLEEAQKQVEELAAKARLLEARSVRLSAENTKLTEAVRQREELIKEHAVVAAKSDKNERQESAKNATGRGSKVTGKEVVIGEHSEEETTKDSGEEQKQLAEGIDWTALRTLAGVPASKK